MSVKIDIGANPAQVVSAVEQLRNSLRSATQAAADLAAVDMSHPELDEMLAKVNRLNLAFAQMRTMTQEGARAAAARASVAAAAGLPPGMTPGMTPPPGPPPSTAYGAPASGWPAGVGRWSAPPGSPNGPPPPAPPPPAPPPRRRTPTSSGDDDGGGAISAIVGMLRGPIGFALSLAGVGDAAKMVGQAVSQGQDEAIGNDKLLRTLRDSALDFDKLRDAVRGAAGSVGVTFGEMGRLSTRYAQIAGSDIGSFVDRAGFAAGAARGYGIDASEGISLFARGENAGLDPKALAAAIGDVIEQGGMQGRQGEIARAITKWAESASRQTGNDPQAKDFADMYIGLNSIAGAPGLHGANAEAIISSMNNTITQGGAAGQASQVFASRALADAGVRDLYAQQYLLQGGMFQNLSARGGKNETVLDAEMDRLNREYGPGLSDVKLSAFQGITGLNTHLGEQWFKGYRPGDSTSSQRYMAEHHIDFSKIGASGYAEISEARAASLTDLLGCETRRSPKRRG